MKYLILIIFIVAATIEVQGQLIGKSREQILKINYAKQRKLISLENEYVMFREGDINYVYYFYKYADKCYNQGLIMHMSKLDATVKEYTQKYKMTGRNTWLDKNEKYMYTITTNIPLDDPEVENYFVVLIEDYYLVKIDQFLQEVLKKITDSTNME